MLQTIRQYFGLEVDPDRLPTNHGATLVANTAFATVGVIGLFLLIPSIVWGEHPVVIFSAAMGVIGAIVGHLLWRSGYIVLSTILHASGLVGAGTLSLLGTQSVGGPTGILYLASVITAGGFLGLKGALVDIALVFLLVAISLMFGDQLRPMLDLPQQSFGLQESLVQIFVFSSIPAWGAYVVAVDVSNRQAWKAAFRNKQRLEKVNIQLQTSQQQQAKIAELGLMALQDASLEKVEAACHRVFVEFVPNAEEIWVAGQRLNDAKLRDLSQVVEMEYALFVDGLVQIMTTRRLRERLIAERAELAARLQRKQRLEALSTMAGGVAHDFNNALMIVTGTTEELMLPTTSSERMLRGMQTIWRTSQHMSEMTNQLLLFAKGLPIREVPVEVNEVVKGLSPMLQQLMPPSVNLSIQTLSSKDFVKLPSDQIERMLLNLVKNSARAFEGKNAGEITIEVKRSIPKSKRFLGQRMVCILVSDDGNGMDAQTRERAIEPYFSSRGSTGLGLSTVHGLIEQAGGQLDILSELNRGTSVTLWIPSVDERKSIETEPVDVKSVLLIDDDEMVREAIQIMLQNQGWRVFNASGLVDAQQILAEYSVQLVLCDVRLQTKEGWENGQEVVQTLQAAGLSAPVLYMTGYVSAETAQLQTDVFLTKPFDDESLRRTITKLQG